MLSSRPITPLILAAALAQPASPAAGAGLADGTGVQSTVPKTPGRGGLPSSGRGLWSRVAEPNVEATARIAILVERLMWRTLQVRSDPELVKRLLASTLAMVELGGVAPRGSRELGYWVAHASLELGHPNVARAVEWLEAALEECPESPLAFAGWLELAMAERNRGNFAAATTAIERAEGSAVTQSHWATLHLERGQEFERLGQLERARLEYTAWLGLAVDETSLARAGWHLALVLDQEGDHPSALQVIDEAESRAHDRANPDELALDASEFRFVDASRRGYAEGVKYRWLATRREKPNAISSMGRALKAFEELLRGADRFNRGMVTWHIAELHRDIAAELVRR